MLFWCLWRNVETSCYKHFVVSRHQQTPLIIIIITSFTIIIIIVIIKNECHSNIIVDRLQAISVTTCHSSAAPCWWHLAGRSVDSTRWSQILAQNSDFCLPHLHSTPPLGGLPSEYFHDIWCGKLAWCGYPMVKIFWKISLLVLTEYTNVTDGRTDGRTDRQADRHRMTAEAALA